MVSVESRRCRRPRTSQLFWKIEVLVGVLLLQDGGDEDHSVLWRPALIANCYNLQFRALNVAQDGSSATIQFKNNNDRSYKSVICADGIHSIGKEAIFPPNTFEEPDHSGTAAIRCDFSQSYLVPVRT